MRPWMLPLAVAAAAALVACEGSHVIGAHCGRGTSQPVCEAQGDAGNAMNPPRACPLLEGCEGMTLVLSLDESGPSLLPTTFTVDMVALPASLRLEGRDASPTSWPARVGSPLTGTGEATTDLPAMFTDASRRVHFSGPAASFTGAPATGATGDDDFALEVVFRAAPNLTIATNLADGRGYALGTDIDGTLRLTLGDGNATVDVVSDELIAGAWHHCVAYVSPARADESGARVDCNARPGSFADLRGLDSLDVDASLTLGGGGDAELVYLALHRAPAALAALDEVSAALTRASRQRFAMLVGTRPYVALGTPLPATGQRASAAWLDMLDASGLRALFLVGRDWPRIVCRPGADGTRFCAYLAEGQPTRAYDDETSASSFTAVELGVNEGAAPFADGSLSMAGLVPTSTEGAHTLTRSRDYDGQSLAFSFFVRAGASDHVGASAGSLGMAVYDLANHAVVAPDGVQATVEDFGGGLYRCSYVGAPPDGPVEHRLHLLDGAATSSFGGDGVSASIFVAGIQIEIGGAHPTSLSPPGNRDVDRLTYLGTDGNLDPQGALVVAEVRLPAFTRFTDHAIVNLSHLGTFDDEINLFVAGASGQFAFGARANGNGVWGFENPTSGVDGAAHALRAGYDLGGLELTVDGESSFFVPGDGVVIPAALDRVDIGHSGDASGPLDGLVRHVGFAPRADE